MKMNKLKKSLCVVLTLICIISSLCMFSFAKDTDIRMANVELPYAYIELTGSVSKSDITSVTLNKEKLSVKSTKKGKKCSKLVYMLIDISSSMNDNYLDALKPSLISYAQSLSSDDYLVIWSFDQNIHKCLSIRGGKDDNKIEDAINGISVNANGDTGFYTALDKAFDNAMDKDGYERRYCILVSDGANYDKNGDSSQNAIVDKYSTHRFPIYGLCQGTVSSSDSEGFSYIATTSGGTSHMYSTNGSSAFSSAKSDFENVTYVTLKGDSKKSLGKTEMTVNVDGSKITQTVTANAEVDNTAPKVKKVEYNKDDNAFIITYSEDVEGADEKGAYIISKDGKDKEYAIKSVKYSSEKATIYMSDTIYSGDYVIKFKGITDTSDKANKLKEKKITAEDVEATSLALHILMIVGLCLIPVIFVVAVLLILLGIKKKKNVTKIKDIFVEQVEEKEIEQVHITQKKGTQVKLYIDGADGVFHTVDYNMISSIIVGRNEMNDVVIADPRISSQHFCLELVEGGIAVTDLNSSNGTFVNGVRIFSRTFVGYGDKISAGNTTIRIQKIQ